MDVSYHWGFGIILIPGLFSSCVIVKTDYSANAKKNATAYCFLPESIIEIRATAQVAVVYNEESTRMGSSKIIEESFVIASEMIADTKDLLSLNLLNLKCFFGRHETGVPKQVLRTTLLKSLYPYLSNQYLKI